MTIDARTFTLSWLRTYTVQPSDATVAIAVSELQELERQLEELEDEPRGKALLAPKKPRRKGMTSKSLRRRSRDPYLDFVKGHPCCVPSCGQNWGIDPHHAGGKGTKGTGLKCSDTLAIPLCRKCHDCWHDHRHFPNMTHEESKLLVETTTTTLQAEYAERNSEEAF